jgi:Domain of Unknown Function (DUF1543)
MNLPITNEPKLPNTNELKLFMVLLGSKAPDRHVEQHDFFFGIAYTLKDLVPQMMAFWPDAGNSLHIDGWREVTQVQGFTIQVVAKDKSDLLSPEKLFFINLGGYQADKLEEQHYTILSVHEDKSQAVRQAMKSVFFKTNTLKGAGSHIDDKYGVDVDDIYQIEDILSVTQKAKYAISILPADEVKEDIIHLGYLRLHKIKGE